MMAVVGVSSGRVIRFSPQNGYGFIAPDDGSEDVFVHMNDAGKLQVGTRVEYQAVETQRGLKAHDVRIIPGANDTAVTATQIRPAAHDSDEDADDDWEILTGWEYAAEVTDILITQCPDLTGAQIAAVRQRLADLARKRGWVEG